MRVEVETKFNKEIIEQNTVIKDHSGKTVEKLATEIVFLREQGIREALIALGWTPPKEES